MTHVGEGPTNGIPREADGEMVPDALFDRAFYREISPDLATSGLGPRKHFAQIGRREGRLPSAGAGHLVDAIRERATVSDTPMHDIVALVPSERTGQVKSGRVWERLRMCTHPRLYAAQFDPEHPLARHDFDVDATISHFLAHGVHEGKRVSGLFNPGWYQQRAAELELVIPEGIPLFFHWLTIGWDKQVVPTPLFDPVVYAERHPGVVERAWWGFVHYLQKGCYRSNFVPSPVGRHHPGGQIAGAEERQEPLLLTEMLYRADGYDLSRTSPLEEACVSALQTYDALDSARMRDLVAKVASIEPLIHEPPAVRPVAGVPPYRARRHHLNCRVEDVRHDVGMTRVDAVLLLAGREHASTAVAERWLKALRAEGPVLTVATEPTDTEWPAAAVDLDLARYAVGMDDAQRIDLLLDLVRGLRAKRIVVIDSALGWELVLRYGRQLSAHASIGARLPDGESSAVAVQRAVQQGFDHLDWLVVGESTRDDLVARYAMSVETAARVVPDGDLAPERALEQPRRKRD